MNLPNKLTLLRVFMIPFFVVFMLTDLGGTAGKWIALAIFILASMTEVNSKLIPAAFACAATLLTPTAISASTTTGFGLYTSA